jgi:hypothetical protein
MKLGAHGASDTLTAQAMSVQALGEQAIFVQIIQ